MLFSSGTVYWNVGDVDRKIFTSSPFNVAVRFWAPSTVALAMAFNCGTLLLVGGSTALSASKLKMGKNSALPSGTVTVRVAAPPKVPVRKKYLFAGPIPFCYRENVPQRFVSYGSAQSEW